MRGTREVRGREGQMEGGRDRRREGGREGGREGEAERERGKEGGAVEKWWRIASKSCSPFPPRFSGTSEARWLRPCCGTSSYSASIYSSNASRQTSSPGMRHRPQSPKPSPGDR